jgi:CheY-like chemotaxis protein
MTYDAGPSHGAKKALPAELMCLYSCPGGAGVPLKILYIEDDKQQADTVTDILKYRFEGIEVQTASDGLEGIRKAREWDPDLILLDLMMPHVDGLEVIHRLRDDPEVGDVPIVIISAWVGTGSQFGNIAEKAGADAFFAKPLEAEQLVNIVARYARDRGPT